MGIQRCLLNDNLHYFIQCAEKYMYIICYFSVILFFFWGNSSKSSIAQLVECLLENGNSRNLFDTSPSDDTILQSLTALSRPRNNSVDNSSSELLQTVLKLLRSTSTTSTTERPTPPETRTSNDLLSIEPRPSSSSVTNSTTGNGLHSFMNGQKMDRSPPEVTPARFTPVPSAPIAPYGCPPGTTAQNSYMTYQPAVPPPAARPFFTPTYPTATANVPNNTPTFNPATRLSAPQPPARPNLPAATANTPHVPQTFNQYLMGRYPPQPPFYPPYQ